MNGYWWECTRCGRRARFSSVTESNSLAAYIWDVLVPSGWNQGTLLKACTRCAKHAMRIAYEFPRRENERLFVMVIVGLTPEKGDTFVPMLWESARGRRLNKRWFDFKYIQGRSNFGLNRPPVFSAGSLREVLRLYRRKTGKRLV